MKVKLLALMVLTVTAVPIVIAQDTPNVPDPSVPDPGDPGDAVPDPEELDAEAVEEEAFPAVERFPCPVTGWDQALLSGETTWQENTHPRADGCVASWGNGSYERGSQAVLDTPGLPTGHLATTQVHQRTINDATQALVSTGLSPELVSSAVAALASGCGNPFEEAVDPVFDICEAAFLNAGQAIHVPESTAGGGALYFEIEHAYAFSEPDENYRAPDGGWLEVKQPGDDWERLRPFGLFEPTATGTGTVCAITAPGVVATSDQLGVSTSGDPLTQGLFPSTTQEWRESCDGYARLAYNEEVGFQEDLDPEQFGIDVADSDGVAGITDQATPYPGMIRGEGPGFVGETTDEDGRLVFVEHWFDLAPYAGETVQVRFNATGGEGIGSRQGGWWVDEANVRYGGPPDDLSVRLEVPEDGASFPPGQPVPVTAVVQNLGRTTSQAAQVELALGDSSLTRQVGELEPLESVRVTAPLVGGETGDLNATATLQTPQGNDLQTPDQGPDASVGYTDMNPDNDEAVSTVTLEDVTDISLEVDAGEVTDVGLTNVTLTVENEGNKLEAVPVDLRVENVDRVTRQPRTDDAVDLGTVATVPVPPSAEANSLGLPDASNTTAMEVQLPADGIWKIQATTPLDANASDSDVVTLGESAPLAFTTELSSVNPGPTPDTLNGGFEVRDVLSTGQGLEETPSFQTHLRNPVGGPETRFLPDNDTALAAYGHEAPKNYSPASTDADIGFEVGDDLVGSAPVDVGLPSEIRTPANVQAWNLREHHVSVFAVGTDADDDTDNAKAFDELAPGEDGRVQLQMRHAANVDFSEDTGKMARVIAVPASTLDVAGTLAELNTTVREATEPLPPEQQAIAQRVMDEVLLDELLNSLAAIADQSQVSRFPQDICQNNIVQQGIFPTGLLPCEDPGVFNSLETDGGGGVPETEFPEPIATTLIGNDDGPEELSGNSKVVEITEPTGWTNFTMDLTEVAKEANPEPDDGDERVGYYVIFDLVTSTDFEEVVATARAGEDDVGSDYEVRSNVDDQNVGELVDGSGTQAGPESFEAPDWTIDEPELVRYEDDARDTSWSLCDTPLPCGGDRVLPMTTNRGWEHLDEGKESSWRYETLGGDPTGLEPGAFVWEGGSLPLGVEGGEPGDDGSGLLSAYLGPEAPEPYSVLASPTIDLSGYEDPVADVTADFSQVKTDGPEEEGEQIDGRCDEAANDPSGTVWTRTGWNVRARPVLEDGSLGEAETVHPLTGYDDCSEAGEVPIRFNGSAYVKDAPTVFQERTSDHQGDQTEGNIAYRAECFQRGELATGNLQVSPLRYPDPLQNCRQIEHQFGHGEPVFGLPMDWEDVRFDLSEFEGQRVKLEVHAIGAQPENGNPRGELRIDDITVKENAPVADFGLEHPTRPTIAPGISEKFDLEITNDGDSPTEEVTVRRTVVGPDGCQVTDPTTVTRTLRDPETGDLGLPPGANMSLVDGRLNWDVPDELRKVYQRQIHVSPLPTLPPSQPPEITIQHDRGTDIVELTVEDEDDCREEIDVETETIAGDFENIDEPSDATDPVVIDRNAEDEDVDFGDTAPVVRVTATDPHNVDSTPVYVTPPNAQDEENEDEENEDEENEDAGREAIAEIVQSASSEGPDSGSLVEIRVESTQSIGVTQVVIPSPDGAIRRLNAHNDPVEVRDLPPGQYFGYVRVDGSSYETLDFTVPLEPPAGADADVSDNTVTLRSEVREEPGLEITDIEPPRNPSTDDPFDVEIELENTGNVPLSNVTTQVSVQPFGIDRPVQNIPVLEPGQQATVTVEDIEIRTPGAQQLEVRAESDDGVSAATGGSFSVFEITEVAPVRQTDEVWDIGTDAIRFVDESGESRVPADTDAPLSLEGAMNLARSPLSALVLNHSGSLERNYDGIAVEWTAEDGTTKLQREASSSGGSSQPQPLEMLTSSRAGAEPGETTPALTGDLTPDRVGEGNRTTLASSGIEGAQMTPVGEVSPSEWTDPGSFKLEVDDSALDGGQAFWFPTSSLTDVSSEVVHELRIPLTKSDWCEVRDEYVDNGNKLQVEVDERRLFGQETTESRGWEANVRLETGKLSSFDEAEQGISGPRLEATPIVPLDDEHTTDWETVTYEIDPSDLLRFYKDNFIPFSTWSGASSNYDDPCEAIHDPEAGDPDADSRTEIVLELRSDSTGEGSSLDLGWFVGEIELDPLDKTIGASSGNHEVAACDRRFDDTDQEYVSPPAVRGCTFIGTGEDLEKGSLESGDALGDQRMQVIDLGSTPVTNQDGNTSQTLTELLKDRPMQQIGGAFGIEDTPGRFTYVDAVALTDLRPSRQGQIDIEVDVSGSGSGNTPLMQVVGAPVKPGEAHGEDAPHRVQWRPLEVCEDRDDLVPDVSRHPNTPLGADAGSIVGQPLEPEDGDGNYTVALDQLPTSGGTVCADLEPVAGRLSWIGIRAWLPTADTDLEIGTSQISMPTPEPERLSPTLRGLTDSTVHEGSWELYDAKLLSMAPPFSHSVTTEFHGMRTFSPDEETTREVLPAQGEPSASIHVRQPASEAEWTLEKASLTVDLVDGEIESDLDLDEDREGPETIELDWEALRAAFDDEDPDDGGWFADAPVLPRSVTGMELDVETQPEALVDPVGDCPTDFEELRVSQDLRCRQLNDLVDAVNDNRTTVATEQQLPDPGIHAMDVLPDRGTPETPRTAHLQLVNPSSVPVELNGTVRIVAAGEEDPSSGKAWGPLQVDPWQSENVTVQLPMPDEPWRVDRWLVETTTEGELDETEDYRSTLAHPTEDEDESLLDVDEFSFDGFGDGRTDEAQQPLLPGQDDQDDDELGWHMEAQGSNSVTALRTNVMSLPASSNGGNGTTSLEELLQDGENPVLTFQHQRDLHDATGEPNAQDTDFAFMAVTATVMDANSDAEDNTVLDGWGPDRAKIMECYPGDTQNDPNSCESGGGTEYACPAGDLAGEEGEADGEGLIDPNEEEYPIFRSSTTSGGVEHERASAWSTAAFEIPVQELTQSEILGPNTDLVRFNILLATCQPTDDHGDGESEMIVDNVAITSGRTLAEIGSEEIPIQAGVQKDYRVSIVNEGAGSVEANVAPETVPSGWTIQVTSQGETLYDSVTGATSPLALNEGESRAATLSVEVPSGARDNLQRVLPLRVYETEAPGARSTAGLNGLVEEFGPREAEPADPGRLEMTTSRQPLPDLQVDPDSVGVEDAEIGRDATVQFDVVNRGEATAEDVQIRATARGPSGTAELSPIKDDDPEPGVRADLEPDTPKQFTFTWRPSEAGTHTIRAMVDAPQDDLGIVFGQEEGRFLGQVQEATECVPEERCPNLVDQKIRVRELQKPDLAVDVNPLPDRVPAGEEIPLAVTVENNGGATARDVELTLTENGLLPVFDTPTRTLDPIEPGNATTLRTDWAPVTPGDILLLGSVTASDDFVGTRPDGSSATNDNTIARPFTVDRARSSVELVDQLATKPGRSDTAEARIVNDGTGPLTVEPRTERSGDVLLGPVLDAPLTVPPDEARTVELVASAPLATQPQTATLDVPLSQGSATVPVTVLRSPDANVFLEDTALEPGETEVETRIVNRGNVLLDGTLHVLGRGFSGSTSVSVGVGQTANVTVPVQVDPGTSAGDHEVATRLDLGNRGVVTSDHRVTVEEAMAFKADLLPDDSPLSGSAEGQMVLRNVGNQPFKGRLAVQGPVSVEDSLIELAPGQSAVRPVTWLSSADANGTLELVTVDGETVATRTLDPGDITPDLEVSGVETRPGVNLEEGMTVQVVATVENAGAAVARNKTLGITIDGTLYQASTVPELAPGEATVVSEEIELPRSGSLSVGAVELGALQRGETAGAVTTVEVAEGGFGLGTIAEVPTIPVPGLVLALGAVAAVSRR